MSTELALVLVFASTAGLAFLLFHRWREIRRRRTVVKALREETRITGGQAQASRQNGPWLAKFGRTMVRGAPRDRALRLKLVRAGWDSRTAPLTYAAVRIWLAASVPMLLGALAYSLHRSQLEILMIGAVGFITAWLTPTVVLHRRTRLRKKRIQKSLPDGLDLMVVCVEAGVGLDAAIVRVADELGHSHPELAHELRVANQRTNAGIPRMEALREMVARTGVDELRAVVSTLVQSEKLGVSIARVLRVSADGLRTRRRQAAEQAAHKAPIKMLVPLILFVLPALIMVIIGPAGIHLMRILTTTAR